MAKKKEDKVVGRLGLLESAKKAHQYEVGAGGSIYVDPLLSNVRGVALPSVALMELLGVTALRDSCSILIDGEPGASKSSLALEMFNWIRKYGGTGNYVDAENKSAVDIASGLLDDVHMWHPAHKVEFLSCPNIEEIQRHVAMVVKQCGASNAELPRDMHIPFMSVIDPLSGLPSAEHTKAVTKNKGAADRGHGGRDEALLWSKWVKWINSEILNLPFILCMVNHCKEKQEKVGQKVIERKYNPGGKAQNYAVTIGLRCKASSKQKLSASLDGDTYQDIWIECTKNSRGPTGNSICVRKYARRTEGGGTVFWWDWDRCTAVFLAGFGPKHESRDIVSVTANSDIKYGCKQLKMSDCDPSEIGRAIQNDHKMVEQLIDLFKWRRIKEYTALLDTEYTQLVEEARAAKAARLASIADEQV